MVKARRLAGRATSCGFFVLMWFWGASAVAGLCVGQPCEGQWTCIPNTQGFGYFPTQWRTWSGDFAPFQLVPSRGAAVEIEAPRGLTPGEALKAFEEARKAREDQQTGPELEGIPLRGAPYVPPGMGAPSSPESVFPPGGFRLDGGPPSFPLTPPVESGDDPLLRGGLPGMLDEEPGFGEPVPLLPSEPGIFPVLPPGPAEPSPLPPPGEAPPVIFPPGKASSTEQPDSQPFPITRAEVQALLGGQLEPPPENEPNSKATDATDATDASRPWPEPLSETGPAEEPLRANWMAALHPGFRGDAAAALTQSLCEPARPVAHEAEVEPQEVAEDFPLEQPFGPMERAAGTDSPPVALDGFCPVELSDREQWTAGDPRWTATYEHRTYLFAGPQQRERFLADPRRYSPACAGRDPVLIVDGSRHVSGETDYCVTYNGRLYLFASLVTMKRFQKDPKRYLAAGGP